MSIVALSAGINLSAQAAVNTDARTLPVRTMDSQSSMAVLASLNVDENRSRSINDNQSKPTDRMGQLINSQRQQPATASVSPDNMSVEELVLKDQQSESADDISDGQAFAGPDTTATSSASGQSQTASIDPAIKSIEDKDGKTYTTLNLSNYAKQVNGSKWSPNMNVNSAMTIKMQALLDWNHASPGPIDGGWGMNSKKALINFQNMKGLQATGKMNQKTWDALNQKYPC